MNTLKHPIIRRPAVAASIAAVLLYLQLSPVNAKPPNSPQSLDAVAKCNSSVPAVAPPGLDAYVKRVLHSFNVPGMAIGIVKDGCVVLQRGYGVRNLEDSAPVDADTMFAIASNTKAFTAASLEILADRHKISMDAPVIKYLPWFRMSSGYVTNFMRVRDLLPHYSGLPDGQTTDLLFTPGSTYTSKEVAEHLATVPLSHSFREHTTYDNILYGVAALVIEKASGEPYAEFLQKNIFTPLGMRDTRFNYHFIKSDDKDVATGYVPVGDPFAAPQGTLKAAYRMSWRNNSGAAGIYSSIRDMNKWILAQLDDGSYQEGGVTKRLFTEQSHRRMWTMQSVLVPDKDEQYITDRVPALRAIEPDYQGFAEGWRVAQYHRYKMVGHTGGWPGFVSRVTMIPDLRLGIVVLTNQRSGGAFDSVTNHILDYYMGVGGPDWVKVYLDADRVRQARARVKWKRFEEARVAASGPSLPVSAYAGDYNSWYGDVKIASAKGGPLTITFSHTPDLVGRLTHWSHDTFAVTWDDTLLRSDAFITFHLSADGKIDDAVMSSSPKYLMSYMFNGIELERKRPRETE